MSTDKRSVATDALETLGTIIQDGGRDAIHLAVEPVTAGETLYPAQDIGIGSDGGAYHYGVKHVGIVDPFLKARVNPGDKFWLVVYPRQITSLRHVWSHPAFPDAPTNPGKAASEAWLRAFIERAGCPSYDIVMQVVTTGSYSDRDGDTSGRIEDKYIFFNGMDAHGDIPSEFWDHVEVVTGQKFHSDVRPSYFSCSC